jgi:hypothetical protein
MRCEVSRTWRSPVAEVNFHDAGGGRVELESLHGTGGVVVTSESRKGAGAAMPAKMSADQVTGTFAPGSALESLTGVGHASIEEATATGGQETATGDRLAAYFAPPQTAQNRDQGLGIRDQKSTDRNAASSGNLQSAELVGHIVLFEQAGGKVRARSRNRRFTPPQEKQSMRANGPVAAPDEFADRGWAARRSTAAWSSLRTRWTYRSNRETSSLRTAT